MSFERPADAYDRFMGRYASPLAPVFADFARLPRAVAAVLDVGCGTGALTAELAARFGEAAVVAIEPSATFADAVAERFPGVTVHAATAERIPLPDATADAALAQLVVHFMADPPAGIGEMRRVTRPGGVVAACVWDHAEGTGPLATFWDAVRRLDPHHPGEATLTGARHGQLDELFRRAGLIDVEEQPISVRVTHPTFAEWWDPYTLGVGPAGDHVAALDPAGVEQLRACCAALLPDGPIEIEARAWAARGVVPG